MKKTLNEALTDHQVHDLIARRWSPDEFDGRPVPLAELTSLFEAARWAPSSYNEQPWSYIIATRENPPEFRKMLSCLLDGNQAWARSAPVLALAVVNKTLARNGKENRSAVHDLGLASANLVFEATSRGLAVHQMAGILPEKARILYGIPDDTEVCTALAIGYYPDDSSTPPTADRKRKKLKDFVFAGQWGTPFHFS